MTIFEKFFEDLIRVEGGYSNNPADSGGPTKYGITQEVARKNGYAGDMRYLPLETAKKIYRAKYWDVLRLNDVEMISPAVALELADTGANMGVARAGEFMQRILNVMNKEGSAYPDIKVDGNIGPASIAAFKSFFKLRGSAGLVVFLRALNCLQGEFYISLAERRQKDEAFIFGWLQNRIT